MRVTDYATAVLELIEHGMSEDAALTGLSRVLHEREHDRLYPKILRTLRVEVEQHLKQSAVVVTVARESDLLLLNNSIENAVTQLSGNTFETRIDSTISGGFIVDSSERRLDASYKKRLLTLYRSLIA